MQWIFGSFRRDALFLVAPGLIALFLARLPQVGLGLLTLACVLESGHVATTVWRTWLHETERQRTAYSWTVPLAVITVVFAWSTLALSSLWAVAIGVTLLHYNLQFVRIAHWNDHAHTWSRRFAHALMVLPILAFHFRSETPPEFASFVHPDPAAFGACIGLYGLLIFAYVVYEARGVYRLSRTWPIAFSSALYAACFLFGRNLVEILAPLMITHAVGYLALNANALRITRSKTIARPAALVIATSFAFGLVAIFAANAARSDGAWLNAVLLAYVGLNICHVIFDTWLWSRTHWESRLIYGLKGPRADIAAIETLAIETPASASSGAAGRAS